MEEAGFKPIDRKQLRVEHEDVIVIPSNNTNPMILHDDGTVYPGRIFKFTPCHVLTTMSKQELGAGFYTDGWGPLPFIFGPVDDEEYKIYIVK